MQLFDANGILPLAEPIIHPMIAADLAEAYGDGSKPTADGTMFRASEALNCSRAIGFRVADIPEFVSVPPEVMLTFDVGNRFHERIQGILARQIGAVAEFVATYVPEYSMSAHVDAVYGLDEEMKFTGTSVGANRVAVEIKTVSGYGWLLATGGRKSDEGPGPKAEHIAQVAIAANAPNVGAQFIHLIYIDKDKQGIAEWFLDMDEQLPARYENATPRELARVELERSVGIARRLEDGMLPTRYIPGYGRVETPPAADTRLEPWNCRYCRWQPICAKLISMPVELKLVHELVDTMTKERDGTEG